MKEQSNFNERIGKKLEALRGDIRPEEVCQALGISLQALSMYETGKRIPRDERKIKFADYYHTTVNDIFHDGKMTVGMKIGKYLKENGITQAHISRKTGIDQNKLSLSTNGSRAITFDEYYLICDVLRLPLDFFMDPAYR